MKAPQVSVLMTVYNTERYVHSAIESILNQSFKDFELVIVDDKSSDHSREIIESFRDKRIRVIWNSVKWGVAYARNLGLEAARGDYAAVLDSDDVAHPDRLRIQSEFLDQNPEVCLVGSAFELINEHGQVTGVQRVPTDALTVRWKLLFGNVFGHSTVIYRLKEARAVGGYARNLFNAEDFDLWVRLAGRGSICNMDNPVVQYRVHNQNLTNTLDATARQQSALEIVTRAIQLLTGKVVSREVVRTLFRDLAEPAADKATLHSACNIVETCVDSLAASLELKSPQHDQLIALGREELHRIARKNPASKVPDSAALRLLIKHDPKRLLDKGELKLLCAALFPSRVWQAVRQLRRILKLGWVSS